MKSTTILLPVFATLGAALPTRPSADVAATGNAHPGVLVLLPPTWNGEVDPNKTPLLLFPEDGPAIMVPHTFGDDDLNEPAPDVVAPEDAHPGLHLFPPHTENGEVDPTKTRFLCFPGDGEDGPVIMVPNAIGDWKRSADNAAPAVEQPPLGIWLLPLFLPPVDGYLDPEKMPFPFFMPDGTVVVIPNFLSWPTSDPLCWHPDAQIKP